MASNVMNCDLVVVGGGGSGLTAAVRAKHLGVKNVVVLEAAKKTGGSAWYAGFSCSNTKWHKEAGYPDTTDDIFRQTMRRYKWDTNYKLIRKYVDSQGPMFDWFDELCDVNDFFIKPEPYVKPAASQQGAGPQGMTGGLGQDGMFGGPGMMGGRIAEKGYFINTKSKDPSIGPGRSGSYLVTRMRDQCKKMGIQVITEARAREFVKDTQGKITGVSVDTKDGKMQVNFKACILASGGIGHNMDKLKKRWPELYNDNRIHNFNCPTAQGDSLDMAEKAGAFVDYQGMNVEFLGPVHHPYSFTIFKICTYPETVYVNLNGERFFSETDIMNIALYPLIKQPKGQCYAVIDDDLIDIFNKRYIANNAGSEVMPFKDGGLRKDIEYEASLDDAGAPGSHTKKANTFEELAIKMKIDPKTFVATMNRYNEYCEKGRDLDMYKNPEYLRPIRKPPFYAFWQQNFTNTTHNGIVINENMELLNAGNKKAIHNLFAAGDNATAMEGGMGWAAVSGFMCGSAAAKYLGYVQGV
jgi:fumarate reductase flavoprotein subunit